jgi:hypothetical protein
MHQSTLQGSIELLTLRSTHTVNLIIQIRQNTYVEEYSTDGRRFYMCGLSGLLICRGTGASYN